MELLAYLRYLSLAVCGAGLFVSNTSAGWICIKNESKVTLVVQDIHARPILKRGKSVKLLPGEVYREYQSTAGERRVQVFEARDPVGPRVTTKLVWPTKGDVTYKLDVVERAANLTLVVSGKDVAPPVIQAGSAKPVSPPKR
jgi:hypothetical protein